MSLSPDNASEFWEQRYLDQATPWDRGYVSPALLQWLADAQLHPCRVLVPGCGRGHEVVELARRGFEVVGLDLSPTAVQLLRQRLRSERLRATVIEADLFHWTPPHTFDAVYEQTCLCALVPEQWNSYAGRLASWLRRSGRLYALFMQTGAAGGPPFHCDLPRMRQLFPEPDWTWSAELPQEIPHPAGVFELASILEYCGA